jgi:hypothetical protein
MKLNANGKYKKTFSYLESVLKGHERRSSKTANAKASHWTRS